MRSTCAVFVSHKKHSVPRPADTIFSVSFVVASALIVQLCFVNSTIFFCVVVLCIVIFVCVEKRMYVFVGKRRVVGGDVVVRVVRSVGVIVGGRC